MMTRNDIYRFALILCTLSLWMGLGLAACQIVHTRPRPQGKIPEFYRKPVIDDQTEQGTQGEELEGVNAVRFGSSCEGRPIYGYVIGEGEQTVLFLAGIHGDEPGGETLLFELRDRISANPSQVSDCCLVIIPGVNPDGLDTEQPLNANGVDLDRNFPASNWAHGRRLQDPDLLGTSAGSEAETQAVLKAIKDYPPDRVISVQSSRSCIDYEGPVPETVNLAYLLSRECDLAVNNLESETGSLGVYVGTDLGLPYLCMELEYRHKRQVIPPFEKKRFIDGMIRFLENSVERGKEEEVEAKEGEVATVEAEEGEVKNVEIEKVVYQHRT